MLPLPGLSPVSGKTVVVKFDGGLLSSDGGILVLREVEQRLRVADRLAACIEDPRSPEQITHSLADIIRFRLLMISAGYEDGNDASNLRGDPMFKMALDLSPSDRELCSQSTISRLENLPDARALLRTGRAMVDLYRESLPSGPEADHTRHRRHIRRGSWRPAVAARWPSAPARWRRAVRAELAGPRARRARSAGSDRRKMRIV